MPDTRANTRSTCKTTLRAGIKSPLSELHELGLPHEIGLVQAREVDPGRESLACEIAADDEREALAVVAVPGHRHATPAQVEHFEHAVLLELGYAPLEARAAPVVAPGQ